MKNIKSLVMVGLLSASMLVSVGCQSTNDVTIEDMNYLDEDVKNFMTECKNIEDIVLVDDEACRITVIDEICAEEYGDRAYAYVIRVENKTENSLSVTYDGDSHMSYGIHCYDPYQIVDSLIVDTNANDFGELVVSGKLIVMSSFYGEENDFRKEFDFRIND